MDPDKDKAFEEKMEQILSRHKFVGTVQADNAKWITKAVTPIFERQQPFELLVDHCLHPSHVLVKQLLQHNLFDKAVSCLDHIRDKTKGVAHIVIYLLSNREPDKAYSFWQMLPPSPERSHLAAKLAQSWVILKQSEKAIAFAEGYEERDSLLREIAVTLTNQGEWAHALSLIEKITDQELLAYAKSNIVHVLALQNQFQEAKTIAFGISVRDYREDAFLDIVKAYLHEHQIEEALQFVALIPEKEKAAQVIAADLKAHQKAA